MSGKKKSTKVVEIPVIPFDEQKTEDAAGKSHKGDPFKGKTVTKPIPGTPGAKGKTYIPYKD